MHWYGACHLDHNQEKDVYLSYVTEIAQNMMEGAMARVLLHLRRPPNDLFLAFTVPLTETIRYVVCVLCDGRNEVVRCCSAAYDSLTVDAFRELLMLENNKDGISKCREYITKVCITAA